LHTEVHKTLVSNMMNGAVSAVLYERKITNAIKDISSRKQLDGQGQ